MKKTPLEKWIADKTGAGGQLDMAKLRAYQFGKFRETLAYVKNYSRFYKKRLSEHDPGAIKGFDDITRLPFTYPDDIAERTNDFLCVSPREIDRIVTLNTSGTTGRPKRVFFTEDDQELTIDFFHHGMTTFTRRGDRVMICMPGNTEGSVGDLLKKGLARFGCESVVYGPVKDETHALNTLIGENITGIVGIPSQILAMARLSENEVTAPTLKSVLLSADYVSEAAAEAIGKAWNVRVYGHYGMTETGLGGGVECDAKSGYHLREADLLFEIVDPASGRSVPDGTYGEVVFSTLTRRGMPLIRYRTGDRARLMTKPCPCGTVLRRLDRVTGRIAEAVTLSDGNTLSVAQLDEAILKEPSVVKYSAQLHASNGRDSLRITVRPNRAPFHADELSGLLRSELPHLFLSGRLLLEITEGDIGYFTTGTLKRKITDLRAAD